MSGRHALGIDIGGTFTDIVLYDRESGRVEKAKTLTTHADPSIAVLDGVRALLGGGIPATAVERIVHATTLFTNALIERKGAVTGLITTEGFRDVVEIGRERKYELYDIFIAMPAPLAPRNLRLEVPERTGPDGAELLALDETALLARVAELKADGVESVAIVFLHAYANPAHEARAAEIVGTAFPELFVSASHDVAPEIREYDRASTTLANAYVKPLAHRYVDNLVAETAGLGIAAPFFMMLSNGGLTHIAEAKRVPVQLLESGPAAGALAAAHFGGLSGAADLLAFDMGGTTAKLALVEGGEPKITYRFEAAREKRFMEGSGLPLNISAIELIEIGAGGGSIARLDALGLLKVGPDSAGSEPGPACYGRGGGAPTVTDADLLLGYLDPAKFAGGSMTIDAGRAAAAIAPLAAAAGMSVVDLAHGIHDVVNENMAGAARVHIAEMGKDPRAFALFATGGAGPVHAYAVARKLGLGRIICPPAAGVASALGLLMAPAKIDRVATIARRLDSLDAAGAGAMGWQGLEAAFAALEDDAKGVIAETGYRREAAVAARFADMRYVGQGFEVVVPLPPGPYGAGSAPALLDAFEQAYRAAFSRTPPDVAAEIINIRVSVRAHGRDHGRDQASGMAMAGTGAATKSTGTRPVYHREAGGFVETPVYDRGALDPGDAYAGPAAVEEAESTLIVGPGGRFEVDAAGNIIVTVGVG